MPCNTCHSSSPCSCPSPTICECDKYTLVKCLQYTGPELSAINVIAGDLGDDILQKINDAIQELRDTVAECCAAQNSDLNCSLLEE